MSHHSIIADRARKRAIAFGREHHTDPCGSCKGARHRVVKHSILWGLIWWHAVEQCKTCHGSGYMPLGDHLGESERLVEDIDLMAAMLETAEHAQRAMRRYGVRAEDLEDIFRRSGYRPRLPIQTDPKPTPDA